MTQLKIKTLKSKKKRTLSSQKWLLRQLNDPYVEKAKECGYRSRAAFKLIEIDEKYKIFKSGQTVVDLGCAPGGWLQVIMQRVRKGTIIGLDLQDIVPFEGVILLKGDFTDLETVKNLEEKLGYRKVDVVLSDMAASACGISQVDHIRIMSLVRDVTNFSIQALDQNGCMIAKVLRGGTETNLLAELKKRFQKVSHFKPSSSRIDSAEIYVIAQGFKKTQP